MGVLELLESALINIDNGKRIPVILDLAKEQISEAIKIIESEATTGETE